MVETLKGKAGAYTVNITPQRSDSWGGHPLVRNESEDSDLLAHAVVFTDGAATGALVSVDVTMIDRSHYVYFRDRIARQSGIPAQHISISATHTHVAPGLARSWIMASGDADPDPAYSEWLGERLAGAVTQAADRLRPAVLVAGNAPTRSLTFNRRYLRPGGGIDMVFSEDRDPANPPAGPADPDLGYWFFEEPDGAPIALVTSFSVHNHVAGGSPVAGRPDLGVFHRDLGGRLGDVVRNRLGSDIPTVFLAGAAGDTSWQDPNVPPPIDGSAAAWKIGSALADALIQHVDGGERRPIEDLRFAKQIMDIPDRPLSESRFCDDFCRGRGEHMQEFDRVRWQAEEKAVRELGDTTCEVEVGAISMSGTAISTNPAELFVEFGLEIKDRSPFEVTLISELTNGWCGYVPTEAAFTQGGYETHRSVHVSRLVKTAGRTITDACVERLGDCRS